MRKQEVFNMNTTVSKPVPTAPKSNVSLGNLPERKIRAGAISATVWLNKGQKPTGEESEYRTISLERSYKDQGGEWKSSNSLRISDVPKAIAALQKAYETIVLNEQDLFKGVH